MVKWGTLVRINGGLVVPHLHVNDGPAIAESLMFLTRLFDLYCTTLPDQIEDLYYRKRMLFLTRSGGKRKKPCTVVKELQLYTDKGFCPPKNTIIVVFLGGSVNEYRAHSLTFLSEMINI